MSARRSESFPRAAAADTGAPPSAAGPADGFLIASMLGGDEAALGRLIDRYDRLVRYTVFRTARQPALQDPQWVDSLASETWTGFVRSMQRHPDSPPSSVATYLIQIARFRTISALRGIRLPADFADDANAMEAVHQAHDADPAETAARLEELAALRECVNALSAADQSVYTQLGPITDRSWQQAASALGLPESTIRSRWKKIIEDLRKCLEGKRGGKPLARRPGGSDS